MKLEIYLVTSIKLRSGICTALGNHKFDLNVWLHAILEHVFSNCPQIYAAAFCQWEIVL